MKAYPREASCHLSFHATLIFEYDKKRLQVYLSWCHKFAAKKYWLSRFTVRSVTVTKLWLWRCSVPKLYWDQKCDSLGQKLRLLVKPKSVKKYTQAKVKCNQKVTHGVTDGVTKWVMSPLHTRLVKLAGDVYYTPPLRALHQLGEPGVYTLLHHWKLGEPGV